MMTPGEFRDYGHVLVDWMANYFENVEQYPVKSLVRPGDIKKQIPDSPPAVSEGMTDIINDFKRIILPGITHWQSPNWFAYFQANSSYPSVLAEMLTAALGAQCMMWETSPSAAELEEKMMDWLKEMTGLPSGWFGVIQDTASTSSLVALLTAREKVSDFLINQEGFKGDAHYRIYASSEAHSSIDKAVRISGIGHQNLVKIPVGPTLALDPQKLEEQIIRDKTEGRFPLCVIATIGTTGTLAIDPLDDIGRICKKHNLWLHVDAAYAGSAMVLPEYRWMIKGIERADSYVFNPHKWMFTNFDCSAYFVADRESLVRTFSILPEYLKTSVDQEVNNYRDWGIQLGRRFRALKLWFVIRNFGVEGIQKIFRDQIRWMQDLVEEMEKNPDIEQMAPPQLNMVCFRYHPATITDDQKLDELNSQLLGHLNRTGHLALTHTKVNGKYTLRLVAGQTYLQEKHLKEAWATIRDEVNRCNRSIIGK